MWLAMSVDISSSFDGFKDVPNGSKIMGGVLIKDFEVNCLLYEKIS